jgi:hypothetical protein
MDRKGTLPYVLVHGSCDLFRFAAAMKEMAVNPTVTAMSWLSRASSAVACAHSLCSVTQEALKKHAADKELEQFLKYAVRLSR